MMADDPHHGAALFLVLAAALGLLCGLGGVYSGIGRERARAEKARANLAACEGRWFRPNEERPDARPHITVYPPNWECTVSSDGRWLCWRETPKAVNAPK